MLEELDLAAVFAASRRHSYDWLEVYAETCSTTDILVEGRKEQFRRLNTNGISTRGIKNGKSVCRSSNRWEPVEELLESPVAVIRKKSQSPISSLSSEYSKLFPILRKFSEGEITLERFIFRSRANQFEVCDSDEKLRLGEEQTSTAEFHWRCQHMSGAPLEIKHFSRANNQSLLADLLCEDFIRQQVMTLKNRKTQWPSPSGELQIHWSANAMAQLLLPLIRMFEGDLVLHDRSLLSRLEQDLPLAFSLQDVTSGIDHEGTERKALSFLCGGKPRALAIDKSLAMQMGVQSTGHCRRGSYLSQPTVGLWAVHLIPENTQENILSSIDKGLTVNSIEVLAFDPATGQIDLRLLDTHLLHHGEPGEMSEPIQWSGSLLDLLSSIKSFGLTSTTLGMTYSKKRQSMLTEISAPEGFSPSLNISGTVPLNHYW